MSNRKEEKKKMNSSVDEATEGKDRLIREIENNAREEARKIIEGAEKTAEQKISTAEGKAKRILLDAEERAEQKIRHINEQTDSSIQITKKRIRLKQTEEIIRHVFDRVREKIEGSIGTDAYVETLKNWAVEGVLGIGADTVVLSVSGKERPLLDDDFLRDLRERVRKQGGGEVTVGISEEPEQEYGVCVRSADGRLEYRNQIATRLARNQDEYRKLIYRALEIEGAS
jgi:vacuolar-type H+-ATPase subunit E/Vma4